MKAKEALDIIRGVVRPYIAISGWTAALVLAVLLALRFADREVALAVLTTLTGSITTILEAELKRRKKRRSDYSPALKGGASRGFTQAL